MIAVEGWGHVFLKKDDTEEHEDLDFVSRKP